ncbi:MAG: hypothetical protein MZV63_29550 [Marinilabiliales bacterium]|nr:hypothetical protein [Marinilabiliales bacterium]
MMPKIFTEHSTSMKQLKHKILLTVNNYLVMGSVVAQPVGCRRRHTTWEIFTGEWMQMKNSRSRKINFFNYYLKREGTQDIAEATIFVTGVK